MGAPQTRRSGEGGGGESGARCGEQVLAGGVAEVGDEVAVVPGKAAGFKAQAFFRGRGDWEKLWGLVVMFFLVVFIVERISVTLRRRLV